MRLLLAGAVSFCLIFPALLWAEVPADPSDIESQLNIPTATAIPPGGWVEGDKSSFASKKHDVPGNIVEFAELSWHTSTLFSLSDLRS